MPLSTPHGRIFLRLSRKLNSSLLVFYRWNSKYIWVPRTPWAPWGWERQFQSWWSGENFLRLTSQQRPERCEGIHCTNIKRSALSRRTIKKAITDNKRVRKAEGQARWLRICIWLYMWTLLWWLSGKKKSTYQFRKRGFDPWAGKIPWKRKWQTTPIFLPRKSHEQRSLVGYSPWGLKRIGHDLATKQQPLWMEATGQSDVTKF